jgi:hypothetical protein
MQNGKGAGKTNCWEFTGCGRQPGGSKVDDLGICTSATETRLDGVNGGVNGGRGCWVVAGSLCGGEVQGTFAKKMHNCLTCAFFQVVSAEERFDHAKVIGIRSLLE